MSDVAIDQAVARVCASCGATQPFSEFDPRFVRKTCKVHCATCRSAKSAPTTTQPRETPEQREVRQREQRQRREHLLRREAVLRDIAARQQEILSQGFTMEDIENIRSIHYHIKRSGNSWSEIKRIYASLVPPCTTDRRHAQYSAAFRQSIYDDQQGRCFYCQRELLPLDVWKRGSKDGCSVIDGMSRAQRLIGADNGIPELDHKVPMARGGSDARANLCYACRRCNQRKGLRTPTEFQSYPHDLISQMHMTPASIRHGIAYEQRGYDKFDVTVPD